MAADTIQTAKLNTLTILASSLPWVIYHIFIFIYIYIFIYPHDVPIVKTHES